MQKCFVRSMDISHKFAVHLDFLHNTSSCMFVDYVLSLMVSESQIGPCMALASFLWPSQHPSLEPSSLPPAMSGPCFATSCSLSVSQYFFFNAGQVLMPYTLEMHSTVIFHAANFTLWLCNVHQIPSASTIFLMTIHHPFQLTFISKMLEE